MASVAYQRWISVFSLLVLHMPLGSLGSLHLERDIYNAHSTVLAVGLKFDYRKLLIDGFNDLTYIILQIYQYRYY